MGTKAKEVIENFFGTLGMLSHHVRSPVTLLERPCGKNTLKTTEREREKGREEENES